MCVCMCVCMYVSVWAKTAEQLDRMSSSFQGDSCGPHKIVVESLTLSCGRHRLKKKGGKKGGGGGGGGGGNKKREL